MDETSEKTFLSTIYPSTIIIEVTCLILLAPYFSNILNRFLCIHHLPTVCLQTWGRQTGRRGRLELSHCKKRNMYTSLTQYPPLFVERILMCLLESVLRPENKESGHGSGRHPSNVMGVSVGRTWGPTGSRTLLLPLPLTFILS